MQSEFECEVCRDFVPPMVWKVHVANNIYLGT